ncbi:MAG TPA: hypothetical protein VNI52_06820 [Sphingobacteriaceae bacterium]|nr:hypothetical protein [Sphingobacteriaceae bacterium]
MKQAFSFLIVVLFSIGLSHAQLSTTEMMVGRLDGGSRVLLKKSESHRWGIVIENAGLSSVFQDKPVQVEIYKDSLNMIRLAYGYTTVNKTSDGFSATASIKSGNTSFIINDRWKIGENILSLSRKVEVRGNSTGGFLSSIKFISEQKQKRSDVNYFAPGMIYGSTENLTEVAIGGNKSGLITWIREDRLPAPLFGIQYKDGTSVTILNPQPKGNTTREDSRDVQVKDLIDGKFQFGSLGAQQTGDNIEYGYMWPGSEGAYTYKGKTYPGGQLNKWRRRYHPIQNDFTQEYKVDFRFGRKEEQFSTFYRNAWRWAWKVLNPKVNFQDIEASRRSLIDMLGDRVETHNGLSGISKAMPAILNTVTSNRTTVMGFVGKALECSNFLLQDADRNQSPLDSLHRRQANNIINSFVKTIKLSPPNGEGFNMDTGQPLMNRPQDGKMYLRSFGDDLKSLLRAIKREKAQGRIHEDWLAWAKSFADWLLPQQSATGGFPRGWEIGTGKIVDVSEQSSYNAIPYLLLLSELTGQSEYKDAAMKVGEYCWNSGQYKGLFVGGTIDNPNVIDKEAGTLSLEAYLELYHYTRDKKWIIRAKTAADFAETWMYIWNIPMPEDENNKDLHWKNGVSTVGLQLISTGHSLADAYMCFDVDEYAKLSVFAKDKHYEDVAKILLHNTKGMLAVPGRTYDLLGPGWQQEHWSLAPMRGIGLHRAWLPWVSTSHLNGIFGLEEYNGDLYKKLSNEKQMPDNKK